MEVLSAYLPTRLGIQDISLRILFPYHLHGLHKGVVIMTLRAADALQKTQEYKEYYIRFYFKGKL